MRAQPFVSGEFYAQNSLAELSRIEAKAARPVEGRLIRAALAALRHGGVEGTRRGKREAATCAQGPAPRL